MKTQALITGIAALFLATAAAHAEPQMPAQYHGNWCWEAEATYHRCDGPDGMDAIFIGPNVFDANLHVQCTLLAITAIPNGHKIEARCAWSVDANPGTYEDRGEHITYFEFELIGEQLVISEPEG